MIEGKPSQTALMVAAMRAHHHAFAPEPKILDDYMALSLGGFADEAAVSAHVNGMVALFASMSDQDTAQLFLERIAHSVCMRSRLVEGQLEAALPRGLKQLVILGAGLDATAYRRTDLTKDLHVFEVDYPSTQVWKRERLKATGAAVPDNVTFVPFDFENETLMAALMTGGVDPNAMTLFPWLGVQPYLTDAAVRGTMEVVCQFPEGSEVVLDFASPDYEITGDLNEEGLQQLSSVVESMGEPFLSRYMPNELEALLRECGFSDVSLHRSKALANRFLGGHEEAFAMPEHVIALASAVV